MLERTEFTYSIQIILIKGYSVIDILNNFFIYVKNCQELNETQKYKLIPVICKIIFMKMKLNLSNSDGNSEFNNVEQTTHIIDENVFLLFKSLT